MAARLCSILCSFVTLTNKTHNPPGLGRSLISKVFASQMGRPKSVSQNSNQEWEGRLRYQCLGVEGGW